MCNIMKGSKGIRQLMYIPNANTQITHSVDKNYWLKSLNTQLNKPTNQNTTKVPKAVMMTNKKPYYKTLWSRVINSQLSPFSLNFYNECKIFYLHNPLSHNFFLHNHTFPPTYFYQYP